MSRPLDENAKYFTAKALFQVLAGRLSEMPMIFRRSDVTRSLELETTREQELLTDALYMLQRRQLIEWRADRSAWTNLVR